MQGRTKIRDANRFIGSIHSVIHLVLTILIVFLVSFQSATAQNSTDKPNSVFVELGGNVFFYSLNYQRVVVPSFGIRAGFTFIDINLLGRVKGSALVVMGTYLMGEGSSTLELGAGLVFASYTTDPLFANARSESATIPTSTIAYRYASPSSGFLFRAGITPYMWEGQLWAFPQLSVGTTF